MSKFFKIGLALVCSFFVTTTLYAQSTIEEVIVTAQRTEQSLQDVPIAVSAFTDEMLAERQIEYASDIQLQVPGISFTATTFGAGGFSIRGITNLATAASSDAGVEIHMNGLPLGLTSVSEIQYLDMERLEVLRGPQGTLFGRNATGGVINLVTAKPTLDEFYGSVDIKYGQDKEQMVTAMLNVPITDQLGFRFAYTNLQKDGIHENLYQFASNDFDDRDGYQWRASFLYEFDDTLRLNLIHNSYDEESNRNQVSGSICQTGANLIQGCVVGGQQVFQQISPMSNGSTLPALLGGNLGFYFPGNLGCSTGANDGTCYNPLVGFETADAETAAAGSNDLHEALVSVPDIPTEFFQANVWASPRHETQESTSQLLLEKDFDQGQLTFSINEKQRVFYRDTSSLSADALSIRWAEGLENNAALYLQDGATLGGVTGRVASAANPLPQIGVPLGYSNPYLNGATCDLDTGDAGVFGGADCIQGFHELPVSGDASFSKSNGTTYEIKYSSDLDGMFNFLVGAIDISQRTESFYNVYASGITMNGLQLPGSISKSYRDAFYGLVGCAFINVSAVGYDGPCDADSVASGGKVVAGIGINDGTLTLAQAGTMADALAAVATELGGGAAATDAQNATAAAAQLSQLQALDKISRIDGVYTEYFHNQTNPFNLNARAIFTEFYFDVANNHKLTLGLRYTQDKKDLQARATFYDSPLVSAWDTTDTDFALAANTDSGNDETAAVHCGIGGEGAAEIAADGTVTAASAACLAIGSTVGQAIGSSPVVLAANPALAANESQYLIGDAETGIGTDAYNADYAKATPAIDPKLSFSKTTGRLVWDWQMNDDTLMYASYSKGFKGGGFNPPFDAAQFPNTPFAFDSTDVQALEFGIKATVPEVGLVANASFYYNDFDNFHLGTIRNETAINLGIPLKSMGAELELLLNPPTVPGLTFNMNLSLYDSEIGDVDIVNPHDLGGHYNATTESANWHVMKSASANSFLVDKDRFGYIYGSILQAKAAVTAAAADDAALVTAFTALSATNELAAAAEAGRLALLAEDATADDAAQAAVIASTMEAAGLTLDAELSAHATAYGTMASTCHFMQVTADAAYINTCMNDAAAAAVGMTGANVATAYDPAVGDSLVYSPVEITDADGLVLATTAANGGALLPSIGILGSGDAIQTSGLCTLWGIFTADYSALPGGHTSALSEDGGTTNGIQIATDAQGNATETCYGTATLDPGLISSGLEQSIDGNPMPFSDLTMSLGIAYTFQTNNLEITPRLDYYYRSETNASVFDIEQNKLPAWDEVNFRLNIVPTNGDWRVVFYGQNLTDDRNITATALTNSSQSFTNTTFVREPRSFGFQFGLDF